MKLVNNHSKWTMPERKVKTKPRRVRAFSPVTLRCRKDSPGKTSAVLCGWAGHMSLAREQLWLMGVPGVHVLPVGAEPLRKGKLFT